MSDIARRERRRRRRRVAEENRKRAPRACDRCKARKSKCIETPSGVCERCLRGSHPCRFARELELSATVFEEGDASGMGFSFADESTMMNPVQADEGSLSDGLTPQVHERIPQGAHVKRGSSAINHPSTSEAFMWPKFLSRLREAFCLDSQPISRDRRTSPRLRSGHTTPPLLTVAEQHRLRKAIGAFPPQAVGQFLVSVCIDHGTDSFFYFDQEQFTSDLQAFYADSSSPIRHDPNFVCLALSVFALGSQWTTLAKPSNHALGSVPDDSDPGRVFYDQARFLMADIMDSSSIRSVQAAFILGVYLMPASAIGASYIYMGLALRKALALNLHRESDDAQHDNREREARRRLWWAIYSLERYFIPVTVNPIEVDADLMLRTTTIKLNRPRTINQDIITVHFPQPYPEMDSVQIFDNVQHQIANAGLVMILDKLSETHGHSSPQNFDLVLKEWKRSLPASLKLESQHPGTPSYRAVVHLYLNYYFAWIAMGKISVVTVVRAHLQSAFRGTEPANLLVASPVEALSRSCIKAAKKMLQLFEDLNNTRNLTGFSFTDFQGCSIATIILFLAGIIDHDGGHNRRAAFGLECLKRMTGCNQTAKMGVRFVEALQSIAEEANAKLQGARQAATPRSFPTSDTASRMSGYSQWANWLANSETLPALSGSESSIAELPAPVDETLATRHPSVPGISLANESMSVWEQAAAIQLSQMATSNYPPVVEPEPMPLLGSSSLMGGDLPSCLYGDDQIYLMGLTGLDVLDFGSPS
ncbi:hypothetical protein VP1G_04671 [Cytospora mali]|uniref:Zn(2)-C6 fungal-type domain-containing protein n=1 Tax=Cytospora mali TaxID=578113 RepID=A0A194V0H8_CYTMA|nr:hypothetical protein VP1G_04671 [Valsa mali var. pyri (nom. inval.)]